MSIHLILTEASFFYRAQDTSLQSMIVFLEHLLMVGWMLYDSGRLYEVFSFDSALIDFQRPRLATTDISVS